MKPRYEFSEEIVGEPSWWARLTIWADQHAKFLIFLSTALLLIVVLVFIQYFWSKARTRRAELELRDYERLTLEDLKRKESYCKDTPLYPRYLYLLTSKYLEEGITWDDAKAREELEMVEKEYKEFTKRFPENHPLRLWLDKAHGYWKTNTQWLKQERAKRIVLATLDSHPLRWVDTEDPRGPIEPIKKPNTQVEIETARERLVVELFDDEAPQAVGNFIKLVEQKFYNGSKWMNLGADGYLMPDITKEQEAKAPPILHFESTSRTPLAGSFVMVKAEQQGKNSGCRFQILLKDMPELQGKATTFGILRGGAESNKDIVEKVKLLTAADRIVSILITQRREKPANK